MGAWIETTQEKAGRSHLKSVAPYVGAWIETYDTFDEENDNKSHPMWVRGLKQNSRDKVKLAVESHPMWVRGLKRLNYANAANADGRTLCGCVD